MQYERQFSPEVLFAEAEEDGPEAGAHVGVDEEVDAGVDGEEEGGHGGRDQRPDGHVVAVALEGLFSRNKRVMILLSYRDLWRWLM